MIQYCKVAFLLAAAFAMVCVGIFALRMRSDERTLTGQASDTLKRTNALISHTDAILNDPRQGIKPTLQNVNAILLQVGLATDQLRLASMDWSGAQKNIEAATVKTLRDADTTINKLNMSVDTLTISASNAIDEIPPTLTNVNLSLVAGTKLMNDSSLILESPTVAATQANVEAISKNAKDVSDYYRNMLLAPKRWWNKAEDVAKHIKSCCVPPLF